MNINRNDRIQCSALTTRKTRCVKMVIDNSKIYCNIHQNMMNNGIDIINWDNVIQEDIYIQKENIKDSDHIPILSNIIDDEPIPIFLEDYNECKCCLQSFSPDDIVMCTNTCQTFNHITCYDCLQGYLESILNEKKTVGCMMGASGCNGRYNDKDVQKALSELQYNKYIECCAVEETIQFASILDNYHMCPFCSQYGVILEDVDKLNDAYLNIQCGRCKKDWCAKCRGDSHVPSPCGKLKTCDPEIIRRVIDKTIDDVSIHKCPKCFVKFNKTDGCNLMTCTVCHIYFCYLCEMIIEPKEGLKYYHFKGSGSADKNASCPLYNSEAKNDDDVTKGNIIFNEHHVNNALTNLLIINADNSDVFSILHKEILKRGYIIKSFAQNNMHTYEVIPRLKN
jgi:hypothetical protein